MSIRKAASLIVCSYNSLAGLQVLLLQRSSFGFYGGLAVFPGGKVDDADGSTDWRNLGLSSDLDRQQPQKLAALRETFEEAGLLLTSAPVASAQALDWRKRVLEAGRAKDSSKYLEMFKTLQLRPSTERLIYWSNWVSPAHFDKHRFDTHFFLTLISEDERNTVAVDGRETTKALWMKIQLLPPQFFTLYELSLVKSREQLMQLMQHRKQSLVRPMVPEVLSGESDEKGITATMVLPGDKDHSTSKDSKEISRFELRREGGKVKILFLDENSTHSPVYRSYRAPLTKRASSFETFQASTTSFVINFSCQIPYLDSANSSVVCHEALATIVHAVSQIETYLFLPVPVTISCNFVSFCALSSLTQDGQQCRVDDGTLGYASPAAMLQVHDAVGQQLGLATDFAYPSSLLRQYIPTDPELLNLGTDIYASFNSDFNWFYSKGTAAENWGPTAQISGGFFNQSASQSYDLELVVIHEIFHGLGFLSTWGNWVSAFPDVFFPSYVETDVNGTVTGLAPQWIFDKLTSDSLTGIWISSYAKAINQSVVDAVTSTGGRQNWTLPFQSSSGYAIGRSLVAANGLFRTPYALHIWYPSFSNPLKLLHAVLYTPAAFAPGSSLSHLDSAHYSGISSFLMRPAGGTTLALTLATGSVANGKSIPGNRHGGFGRTLLGIMRAMGYITIE
ncbi:hypothetical protein HDU91_000177 [Kappamyces sp. JEL0680]|nr:hypothetical protein HDU91_000177 [Kappamyces sp. JEL0680]